MTILTASGKTDVGRKRRENQDTFRICPEDRLFLVCDGMGGEAGGQIASSLAAETLCLSWRSLLADPKALAPDPAVDWPQNMPPNAWKLVQAIRLSSRRLFRMALEHTELRGMGTTVAALILDSAPGSKDSSPATAVVTHVGDSRVWRLRNGKLQSLTKDHSWVNELLDDKEITEEQARVFKRKNIITRALGNSPAVAVDVSWFTLQDQDIFLLSSDGLHGVLSEERMTEILLSHKKNMTLVSDVLIQEANALGGPDNITAVAFQWNGAKGKSDSLDSSCYTIPRSDKVQIEREDKFLRRLSKHSATNGAAAPARPESKRWAFGLILGFFVLLSLFFLYGVKNKP